jgi:hypothetical protein
MEIRINCRLKLESGVVVGPGLFNDGKELFHPKVYGEIVMGRPTVKLLSGTMKEAIQKAGPGFTPVGKSDDKVVTTQDPGSDLDTETTEIEKKTRHRRTRR